MRMREKELRGVLTSHRMELERQREERAERRAQERKNQERREASKGRPLDLGEGGKP